MKLINEDNSKKWLKKEKVPAQEWVTLSIDGIPQEIIDEIYDQYSQVGYDFYLKPIPKRKGEIVNFLGDYVRELEEGEFTYLDPSTLKESTSRGTLCERYNIVGRLKDGVKGGKVFDLLSVYSYNTIKVD
jgi:hypothetical protein